MFQIMNNHEAILGRQIMLTAGYLELDKFLLAPDISQLHIHVSNCMWKCVFVCCIMLCKP